MRVGGGSGDRAFEIGPTYMVRAGAGEKKAPRAKHLYGAQIELLVAAKCSFNCPFGLGEGGGIEDDSVEDPAGIRPIAKNIEGVGFDPVHLRGEAGAVCLEIPLGDLKRRSGGIDSRNLGADASQMKSEAALVAADVESLAGGGAKAESPRFGGGIVGPLIEECAGLLSRTGIEMELEAVKAKRSGRSLRAGIGGPERRQIGSGQAFNFANAGVWPLENGSRSEFVAQHADASLANTQGEEPFGEELNDDQGAVLVDNKAWEFVRFTEAKAAGRVVMVEELPAPGDGGAKTRGEQFVPGRFVDLLARDEPESDLGGGAVERCAKKKIAGVGDLQERRGLGAGIEVNGLDVRGVNP